MSHLDRMRRKEERKKEKELHKMLETPEEKRRRRMEKKMKKHGLEEGGSIMGYTNETNPFGDSNLTEQFVWKKKKDQERDHGVVKTSAEERRKRDELRAEIRKAQERREQREKEKQLWEEEKVRMQRESENMEYEGWEEKEDEFHRQQNKLRSDLRVMSGRAKPVDALAKALECDLAVPVITTEPYRILEDRNLEELEEIKEEIKNRIELAENLVFWKALLLLTDNAIGKARNKLDASLAVHGSVRDDVNSFLSGKDLKQLEALEVSIKDKLESGDALDADYWESVLPQLHIRKAEATLEEIHQSILRTRLDAIKGLRTDEESKDFSNPAPSHSDSEEKQTVSRQNGATKEEVKMTNDSLKQMGRMEEDEAVFDDQVALEGKQYAWMDKYRPRQPKYINRVQSGFEWNKYNQTHYDHDNPPPRVVQGYKFNVFYPDLIDKTRTPRYFIEPIPGTIEFVTLRFHAGPPYEDVAFKIINREWEYSHKYGFRSEFRNGVLHLYFNFKRYRYKR